MAFVRLKGLNSKTKVLADGRRVTYWWAWKGGPKIDTQARPGTPEFMAAYTAAIEGARPQPKDTLAGLVERYRQSPEFTGLAPSTRKAWSRWLDRIAADKDALDIGGLTLKALDDRRVRADLLDWRDQWAATPRQADYAMQVLGRVLSWGMGRGLLALNAVAGASQLYENNRADQIWTAQELDAFEAAATTPEVELVPRLACLTGLRRGDLVKLADKHIGELAIVMATGKSRGRKTQTIPILPELREVIAKIRAQRAARHAELTARAQAKGRPAPIPSTTLLNNTRGRPWTPDGLDHAVIATKQAAKPPIDKHLHDAKGTFGTRLRRDAQLTKSEIADVLGWEEDRVERLLKTYVDQDAIVLDIVRRIAKAEKDRTQ